MDARHLSSGAESGSAFGATGRLASPPPDALSPTSPPQRSSALSLQLPLRSVIPSKKIIAALPPVRRPRAHRLRLPRPRQVRLVRALGPLGKGLPSATPPPPRRAQALAARKPPPPLPVAAGELPACTARGRHELLRRPRVWHFACGSRAQRPGFRRPRPRPHAAAVR